MVELILVDIKRMYSRYAKLGLLTFPFGGQRMEKKSKQARQEE